MSRKYQRKAIRKRGKIKRAKIFMVKRYKNKPKISFKVVSILGGGLNREFKRWLIRGTLRHYKGHSSKDYLQSGRGPDF